MIIGDRHISDSTIIKYGDNLVLLAQKSIPACCANSKKILDNQLFFLLSRFRNQTSVPYHTQQRVISNASIGITSITGTMGTIHDMEDVLSSVDINIVFGQIFGKRSTSLPEDKLHAAIDYLLGGLSE